MWNQDVVQTLAFVVFEVVTLTLQKMHVSFVLSSFLFPRYDEYLVLFFLLFSLTRVLRVRFLWCDNVNRWNFSLLLVPVLS